MANDSDYFMKLASRAKPLQEAVSRPKAPAAPKPAKVPSPPQLVKSHTVYQDEDYDYMTKATRRLATKLAPKSAMGKSSPKR
jgi:hypothetical protein